MKNNGFSAVVILLAVIAVTLIGFTGYYVYNNQNKKDVKQAVIDKTNDTQTSSSTSNTAQDGANTENSTQKYLVIKEWGVKIPLTDDIADAEYTFSNRVEPNGYAHLTKKSLVVKWPDCTSVGGAIVRFKDSNDELFGEAHDYSVVVKDSKKIGEFYYYRMPSGAGCGDPEQYDETFKYKDSFITAANNIIAI